MTRLHRPLSVATLIACALLLTGTALARSSDRNKPMDLTSNKSDCSLDAGVCHLLGNVEITQGTLAIQAAKADLYLANGELSRAILTGSPVVMSQETDDGQPMKAQSAKVEYNLTTDTVVFIGNAVIRQPRGILEGDRVVYNMASGQISSGGEGSGRVQMRILPQGNSGSGTDSTPPATEPATDIDTGTDTDTDTGTSDDTGNPQDGG